MDAEDREEYFKSLWDGYRKDRERERVRLLEHEKNKLIKDLEDLQNDFLRMCDEQKRREGQMQRSSLFFHQLNQKYLFTKLEERNNLEFEKYKESPREPRISSTSSYVQYLYDWEKSPDVNDLDDVLRRVPYICELLKHLNDAILEPLNESNDRIKYWKMLKKMLRETIQNRIEEATFYTLKVRALKLKQVRSLIEKNQYITPDIKMCLWGLVELPEPVVRPPEDFLNSELHFPDIGMDIILPLALRGIPLNLRSLWNKLDYYSSYSYSYFVEPPQEMDFFEFIDLDFHKGLNYIEWYKNKITESSKERQDTLAPHKKRKRRIRTSDTSIKKTIRPREYPPLEPEDYLEVLERQSKVHYETPHEVYFKESDKYFDDLLSSYTLTLQEDEVNLREYVILGGTAEVSLFKHIPQPLILFNKWILHTVKMPYGFDYIDFHEDYTKPEPPALLNVKGRKRPKEEIEKELEIQEKDLERLALLILEMPNEVIWFKPPLAVLWNTSKKYWTSSNFHNVEYAEEQKEMQLRVSRFQLYAGEFGAIGLATHKYHNLPFKSWEMKCILENENQVELIIEAAIITVTFLFIESGLVGLSTIPPGSEDALSEFQGKYFQPNELLLKLSDSGLNLVPEHDAWVYLESQVGRKPRHTSTENHVYRNMAILSTTHAFASAPPLNVIDHDNRNIVFLIRKYNNKIQEPEYQTMLVTSKQTAYIDPNIESENIHGKINPDTRFWADLYNYAMEENNPKIQRRIHEISDKMYGCIYTFLTRLKLFSYTANKDGITKSKVFNEK